MVHSRLGSSEKSLAGTHDRGDLEACKLQIDRSCRRPIPGTGFVNLHFRGRVSGEDIGQRPLILVRVGPIDLRTVVENSRHLGHCIDSNRGRWVGCGHGMGARLDGPRSGLDG